MVLHNDKWARKAKKAVERRKGVKLTSDDPSKTHLDDVQVTEEGDGDSAIEVDPESVGDGRFARRKVVDNSARYDESFDPYLETEVPEETYHTLTTRPFEIKDREKVNDDRPTGVLKMDDTTDFDAMRLVKQKEEYARDLKMRFGVRKGYEKNPMNTTNDDAFFDEIDSSKLTNHRTTSTISREVHSRPEDERFLDELLKL